MQRVNLFGGIQIQEFEVIKETQKTVWFKKVGFSGNNIDARELKISSYYRWFETLEEARMFVSERLNKRVVVCKKAHDLAIEELTEFYEQTNKRG